MELEYLRIHSCFSSALPFCEKDCIILSITRKPTLEGFLLLCLHPMASTHYKAF